MKKWSIWLCLCGILLASNDGAHAASADKDTITVAFGTESTTLDPSKAAAGADYFFIAQMFEQLLRRGPPDGAQLNWLAESFSVDVNGGKPIIDIHLRPNVKFHNGDPLTSEDFEFAFNRQRDPKISRTAHLQQAVSKFEIIDSLHFRLHFSEGDATYVTDALRLWALPKKYFEKVGDDGFLAHPIGTGPWKFVSRSVKDEIRFELFDDYWNKEHRPTVKKLVIKIIPEDLTRVAALKTGAVDLIESVPVTAVADLKSTPGIQTATVNTSNNLFIQLPTHLPNTPWNDIRVRKAAAYAIDMDAIVKGVLLGQGEHSTQLSSDDFGYEASMKPYPYDPAQSRKLLAEAGFPRGFDTPCYNIITQREANLKEVGEAVFAYFGAVGIRCKTQGVDYSAWLNLIRRSTSEGPGQRVMDGAASAMYGHSGGDASNAWSSSLHSFDAKRGYGQSSFTNDPEIDRLVEEQKREMDSDKRLLLIRKIAHIKNDQFLGGIPTYRPLFTLAWRDNIKFIPWPMHGYWRSMQEIGFK